MVATAPDTAPDSGARPPARPRPTGGPSWLPRAFYARAALIVLLPVLMVQLAVGVSFIQRHYADVTDQMTRNAARSIAVARLDPALAPALDLEWSAAPAATRISWYDLSGRAMLRRLQETFPDMTALDIVSERKVVRLGFADGTGLSFSRNHVSASNPHQLLVLMLLVGLLMTAVALLFLRGQIRPIRRLADAAEAFGKGRSTSYKPSGATEIRQAGAAFLEMRSRIERHIEQRTLLLSGVSHDLRTPLTRMKLALEMMDDPEADALREDVEAMERIIHTFLDFARVDAAAGREPVDVFELVAGIAAETGATAFGHPVTMRVSRTAMERAVDNLLRNAARYGRRSRAEVIASDHAVVIRVDDDGPGIPKGDREAAKRPFARLDPARSNPAGNVGLGLAIVQDVARAHGGTLRLGESDWGGLRAEIVLPR